MAFSIRAHSCNNLASTPIVSINMMFTTQICPDTDGACNPWHLYHLGDPPALVPLHLTQEDVGTQRFLSVSGCPQRAQCSNHPKLTAFPRVPLNLSPLSPTLHLQAWAQHQPLPLPLPLRSCQEPAAENLASGRPSATTGSAPGIDLRLSLRQEPGMSHNRWL